MSEEVQTATAERSHIEVKSWKPKDTVWIEFDSDGDLLFMDSYGYSIVIHKSDVGKAIAWIEEHSTPAAPQAKGGGA